MYYTYADTYKRKRRGVFAIPFPAAAHKGECAHIPACCASRSCIVTACSSTQASHAIDPYIHSCACFSNLLVRVSLSMYTRIGACMRTQGVPDNGGVARVLFANNECAHVYAREQQSKGAHGTHAYHIYIYI